MLIHYVANPTEVQGLDIILPFLLLFAILFLALSRMKGFPKNISMVIALILSGMVIITHLTGKFPPCYDLIVIMNNAMPQFGLLVLFIFTFVLITRAIGLKDAGGPMMGLIIIGSFAAIAYIFLTSTTGYYRELCPKPEWSVGWGPWLYFIIGVVVFLLIAKYVFRRT